jgi:hypothetical protein
MVLNIGLRSVTKLTDSLWVEWTAKHILKPGLSKLCRISGISCWAINSGSSLNIVMTEGNQRPTRHAHIVGILYLSKCYQIRDCYRVNYLRIRPKFRGRNIARKLYRRLVLDFGYVIMSGKSQTQKSHRLWTQLCRMQRARVWVYHGRSRRMWMARVEDGTVVSDGLVPHEHGTGVAMVFSARKPSIRTS